MLHFAITGNIASGKSLFESFLQKSGFKVLCLDSVTHKLYETSEPLKNFLLKKFNTQSRREVSNIVFKNPELKKELEDFIFPLIYNAIELFFKENRDEKILFVSASMLFEAGFEKYFDKIVLISADTSLRLERLMKRNSLTQNEALARIEAQMSEDDKASKADFIIENNGSKEELERKTLEFLNTVIK